MTTQITDQAFAIIEQVGREIEVETLWDLKNEIEYGAEATCTQDTLDDFDTAKSQWRECASVDVGTNYRIFHDVQVRKGDTRRTIAVVDVGTMRVSVDIYI